MTGQTTRFLLVPDSGAGRRMRRIVAEGGARAGVVVGTWPELVEHVVSAYLMPARHGDWEAAFYDALAAMPDAFWSRGLEVAPRETAVEVEAALSRLVAASDPGSGLDRLDTTPLPSRVRRHVDDLARLIRSLDGALPAELAAIRDLLATDPGAATRRIVVSRVAGAPVLTRWQTALVDRLNRDAGAAGDEELDAALKQTLGDPPGRHCERSEAIHDPAGASPVVGTGSPRSRTPSPDDAAGAATGLAVLQARLWCRVKIN